MLSSIIAAFLLAGRAEAQVTVGGSTQVSPPIDPCATKIKKFFVINLTTAGTTQIDAAVASEFWYICSINVVTTLANSVLIASDNDSGCGSLTAGLNGGTTSATGWPFTAGGGIALGVGNSFVMKSATANHYLCIATSVSTQTSGGIVYVSAP